jgi:outer membrane protein OmpA-like peptidoglycan-associated protein
MKCRVLQAMLVMVFTGMFLPMKAQKSYYVVVGAFSAEGDVKEFSARLPSMNADTAYAMNYDQSLVQLYVMRTTSEDLAMAKSSQLQSSIEAGRSEVIANYESVSVRNTPEGKFIASKKEIDSPSSPIRDEASASRASTMTSGSMATAPLKAKGKVFKFTLSDTDGQILPGNVHLVDFEHERDIASYPTYTYTDIVNPGRDKELAVVSAIFGYKQKEKSIDYRDPSGIEGAYRDELGAWVIPFELERLEKGDVSVMYNVTFHKDAVIMLPHSKSDLDELLNMMLQNPNYEITVHGHCNGKNDRKIIAMTNDQEYFEINGSKEFLGSAKTLSELRADAIKQYLVMNGIAEKRIKTFAWGGRYMLVDEEAPHAKLNDRIEIEIRKD